MRLENLGGLQQLTFFLLFGVAALHLLFLLDLDLCAVDLGDGVVLGVVGRLVLCCLLPDTSALPK